MSVFSFLILLYPLPVSRQAVRSAEVRFCVAHEGHLVAKDSGARGTKGTVEKESDQVFLVFSRPERFEARDRR